ncbi:hypothetical protein BJV82DRAFT_607888 [Fennellomyces sp. T-0311]|nr:hypothetical protein BJV82DRAFT_607888 [Fennellomyces sp. T-0311]
MVQFSGKSLLFSAVLLALSLDMIYADDTCQGVEQPCGGQQMLTCCDGYECYDSNGVPGAAEGVCQLAKPSDGVCIAKGGSCRGGATCCGDMECFSESGDDFDSVCTESGGDSGDCEYEDGVCDEDSDCCENLTCKKINSSDESGKCQRLE